jgi:small subunit ribosomal protein S18
MVGDSQEKSNSRTPLDFTWTDVGELSNFVTSGGRILPRKVTGLSARHQRHITRMIKRARNMLLMK